MDAEEQGLQILYCFLNELRSTVNISYGDEFWEKEPPGEIIEVANRLYSNHQEQKSVYPLSKEVLKEITFNFFEWLFTNKFTDHRLLKKTDHESKTEA